ncbi:bifunctional RNase H/acid phosphatase [Kineococcus gynurae]|uniref:Bifunctional RNase H/acid phosphatase n=1 Tax=Kineococcus gynurae TaxID=452979 RepID=A0ABV5LQE1_9ACTN
MSPTGSRRLRVEADGGSRGNPGPAGFGALVKDAATGELLAEVAEAIGTATNNVAEYRGLIAGLRAAREIDPGAAVEVRMDSKLVVEQMSGRWKVKHADMRVLADEARELLSGARVDFGWIPRAQNSHADRLANEAMDAAAQGRQWQRSPAPAASAAAPARPATDPDPDAQPVRLVLVRHGSTADTEARRLSGRYGVDPELSATGREEALAAARSAEVRDADVVICSTLRRARETAEAVAARLGLEVRVDPRFDETDFGEWDGCTGAEVMRRWPEQYASWAGSPAVGPPGGESLTDVERRVLEGRDDLLRRYAGRTVVLVTHGDPLRIVLRAVLGVDGRHQRRIRVDCGSRTLLRLWPDGTGEVVAVNRV